LEPIKVVSLSVGRFKGRESSHPPQLAETATVINPSFSNASHLSHTFAETDGNRCEAVSLEVETFQLAKIAVPQQLFAAIIDRIGRLVGQPTIWPSD
jgi:hypothetical protein